jgi:hypothetical protein
VSDLTEFLLARIAEDEATARGAHPGPWNHWPEAGWIEVYQGGPTTEGGPYGDVIAQGIRPTGSGTDWNTPTGKGPYTGTEHTADHICRHDPARVLAECEAKRLVIQAVDSMEARIAQEWGESDDDPDPIIAMAAVYADHPDYRLEWRQVAEQLVHDLTADRAWCAARHAPE